MVRTVISSRRLFPSMAREQAEMKPAMGALTLSLLLPRRLMRHNRNLYDELNNMRNRPK